MIEKKGQFRTGQEGGAYYEKTSAQCIEPFQTLDDESSP